MAGPRIRWLPIYWRIGDAWSDDCIRRASCLYVGLDIQFYTCTRGITTSCIAMLLRLPDPPRRRYRPCHLMVTHQNTPQVFENPPIHLTALPTLLVRKNSISRLQCSLQFLQRTATNTSRALKTQAVSQCHIRQLLSINGLNMPRRRYTRGLQTWRCGMPFWCWFRTQKSHRQRRAVDDRLHA